MPYIKASVTQIFLSGTLPPLVMKLNLGCGRDIRAGYVNVDMVKLPGVDRAFDFNKFPYPFKDGAFEEVLISHVLEHLDDAVKAMEEVHRICRNGAIVRVLVPYFNHHNAFEDPQHRHFFTLGSFDYYTENFKLNFYTKARFRILSKRLKPSWLGRLVPFKSLFLNMLAMIFGELAEEIQVELQAVK